MDDTCCRRWCAGRSAREQAADSELLGLDIEVELATAAAAGSRRRRRTKKFDMSNLLTLGVGRHLFW